MNNSNDEDSAAVEQLLAGAGRRAAPPPAARDAAYASTLLAWQQALRERQRQKRKVWAVAAGMAAMACGLIWQFAGTGRPPQIVAWSMDRGQMVRSGDVVTVAAPRGRAFLTLTGERLRVAAGSEIAFTAAGRLQLRRGRIYVESTEGRLESGNLEVSTRLGTVQHVGTRYSVAAEAMQMVVSVRDGRVMLATPAARTQILAGTRVTIDSAGQESNRQMIGSHGKEWEWADAMAPALQIDGRPLTDVLRDVAFETGRRLEYADEDTRLLCSEIRLKGPFLEMPASDRLFAVLVTTGLEATESGDRILIQRRTDGPAAGGRSH
jgi:ferric-dicitrate binding protein FerR (iron transport regulator)